MGQPKVTILVPVYNVEKYLHQCMDSIVNQTLKNIEIICIDDGSTDSSSSILDEYASRDNRIKVIHKKNTGYGNSMNLGLDSATGEYIGIVESDDFADPKMFETLYSLAKKDDLDVARSEFYFYGNATGSNKKTKTDYVPHNRVFAPSEERSVFYQQPSIWANIYRASFIKENEIRFLETPGASYQDTAFSFKVYSSAERFEMIDEAFLHYRINENSSSVQSNSKVYCVCDEYDEIWRFVKERGLYETYRTMIPHLQYNGYKWNYERLADPYNEQFMERWISDFKELWAEGNIVLDEFRPEERQRLAKILFSNQTHSDPKVSVIVPVYNSEKYLNKCLDSLISQTLEDIEIICVNDGSTDSSRKILQDYAENDSRFVIVDKKNGGLSSARNAGIRVAKADYIVFLDSDDWVVPEAYENVYRNVLGVDIVFFGTQVVGDYMSERRADDERYYSVKYSGIQSLNDEIISNVDVSAWDKMFRRDIIVNNNLEFPEGKLYEDYAFYWQYISCCKVAYFDQSRYHRYLRHEGSIMANTFAGSPRALEHLDVADLIFASFKESGYFDSHHSLCNSMFLNCFWFAYLNTLPKYKRKAMDKARAIADKYNLTGHHDIDNLRCGRYDLVDIHKNYSFKSRLAAKFVHFVERQSGMSLNNIIRCAYGDRVHFNDNSSAIATTQWVQEHEKNMCMTRWWVAYDSSFPNPEVHRGMQDGISGKIVCPDLTKWMVPGRRFRFFVTLFEKESVIIEAVVPSKERFITGTVINNGVEIHYVTVDCDMTLGTVSVFAKTACDIGVDFKNCKLYRIEHS